MEWSHVHVQHLNQTGLILPCSAPPVICHWGNQKFYGLHDLCTIHVDPLISTEMIYQWTSSFPSTHLWLIHEDPIRKSKLLAVGMGGMDKIIPWLFCKETPWYWLFAGCLQMSQISFNCDPQIVRHVIFVTFPVLLTFWFTNARGRWLVLATTTDVFVNYHLTNRKLCNTSKVYKSWSNQLTKIKYSSIHSLHIISRYFYSCLYMTIYRYIGILPTPISWYDRYVLCSLVCGARLRYKIT